MFKSPSVKPPLVKLSASRLKTLEHCTWIYHCKYNLKLPDTSNDGARRGTVCHLILEVLLHARRSEKLDQAIKQGISSIPSCLRLIKKTMVKEGIEGDFQENYDTIIKFIDVALNADFKMSGYEVQDPEYAFDIENENPRYRIVGFIDKFGIKNEGEIIKIVDYKSSKSKFSGGQEKNNIQALMYQLAMLKKYPNNKRSFVDFVFMKFPKNPTQSISKNINSLKAFEVYLSEATEFIEGFDFRKAVSGFGSKKKEYSNLCGKGIVGFDEKNNKPYWNCPFRFPFEYYVLLNETGDFVKSSKTEEDLGSIKKEGMKVEKRSYGGCPVFNPENYKKEIRELKETIKKEKYGA